MKRFKAQITNVTENNNNFLENNKNSVNNVVTIASLYINGNFKESKTISTTPPKSAPNLYFGGDGRSGNAQYFRGKIYSLYLFDNVRTPNQVRNDVVETPAADDEHIIYAGTKLDDKIFNSTSKHKINDASSTTPLTIEARITIDLDESGRQGVIVGNYPNQDNNTDKKSFNIEIHENYKVRVYFNGTYDIKFNSNLKNYQLKDKNGNLKPFYIAITLQCVEGIDINDVNIEYTSTSTDDSPQNIANINEPYLKILKNRMGNAGISLENNNIFFYKVQDILKLYTKDENGNIYPINVQSVNEARGVSASAIEPILYNIFMNKLLDYSIADTFDRTYLQNNDQS